MLHRHPRERTWNFNSRGHDSTDCEGGVGHAIALFPGNPLIFGSLASLVAAHACSENASIRKLRIGITCYPSVGGSGILASALGENLARLGHEVHFIGYERPFRLPPDSAHLRFHPVVINDYDLFKYPDYTLPLSVKMAEVSREFRLDVLHVHYAVPHATAAILAREMLPAKRQPKVSYDIAWYGHYAPGPGPWLWSGHSHALNRSDAVTAVSAFLKNETHRLLDFPRPNRNHSQLFLNPRSTATFLANRCVVNSDCGLMKH